MIKISAVIITHNEEKNIARCLQSLEKVADEIIVIDSFSSDRTREVCSEYNVRFFEQEWLGYGGQKNYGNAKASYEYILSLDADEILSPELQQSILAVKDNWTYDAYSFKRLNMYCGKAVKHCGWYPDKKVRLWDRRKGEWNSAEVHEVVELHKGVKVKPLKGDIIHYAYATTNQHAEKIQKYSDLWLKEAIKKGKKSSYIKVLVAYTWRFFTSYIIRMGFLDGATGLVVCNMIAYETFTKYAKLYQYSRSARKNRNKSFS